MNAAYSFLWTQSHMSLCYLKGSTCFDAGSLRLLNKPSFENKIRHSSVKQRMHSLNPVDMG